MIALALFPGELGPRKDGRVDFAPQPPLRLRERLDHLARGDLADDEEIDIAFGTLLAARNRPVDECRIDPAGERPERISQEVRDAEGLDDQAAQLVEDRTRAVRAEIDLVPAHGTIDDAGVRERRKLALERARGGAGRAGDLAKIEFLVGTAVEMREDRLHGFPEQGRSDGAFGAPRGRCRFMA